MEKVVPIERFRREAVRVEEAQRRIGKHIRIGRIEEVGLEEAFGRRLAEDLYASHPMPHFRRSGMDGYAVASRSIREAAPARPVVLEVIEDIPCGAVPAKTVTDRTASRIMTGAMLPDGADTVIMLEMTETIERGGKTYVSIKRPLSEGVNVTPAGMELAEGELFMKAGVKIRAGETALLASFGYETVRVYARPRVAVFATGSELLEIGQPLQPGKIRNSNSYMAAALVREAGGVPMLMGAMPDDADAARIRIEAAFDDADLIVTTGGVSVGVYDIMVDYFAGWEGTLLFNKVTMRPGSPTTAGVRNNKPIFALSGNPGACFVGFELFVRPVLYGMQGKDDAWPKRSTAYLDEDYPKVNAYERYVRGMSSVEDGKVVVRQAGIDQSGITTSIMKADCLIVIPPGGQGVRKGELVETILLGTDD